MTDIDKHAEDDGMQDEQEKFDVAYASFCGLPVREWKRGMVLKGVSNAWWLSKTGGFPARANPQGTHPLFVLANSTSGFRVCPCTSRKSGGKYIKKGCKLKLTARSMDRNSYIIERYAFNIPRMMRFAQDPKLVGVVPETCLAKGGK